MKKTIFIIGAFLNVISAIPANHIKGIQIQNKGQEGLWIEMTNEDSFLLPAGQTASVILNEDWSGKIVAKSEECQYKKCNSPFTVAELMFGVDGKEDRYRVSVIDGYNKAMKITPTTVNSFCKSSSCQINLKENCPSTHQVKIEDDNAIIACRSIEEVFRTLCPLAASVDSEKNMISCPRSNTYRVSIG